MNAATPTPNMRPQESVAGASTATTPAAQAALEKASGARAASVKSAVRVALKTLDADSDERLEVATLTEDHESELVEDPVDLDLNVDGMADDGKEGSS